MAQFQKVAKIADITEKAPRCVEIGSKRTRKRDETIKRRLYQRSGVSEYWVVDPELDVVRIYRADAFERPQELSRDAGDVLRTPLLPGLEVPLAAIFKE